MLTWLNPRVITIVVSLVVLLQVSRHEGAAFMKQRAILSCAALLCACIVAFILPLWRSFGARRIALPLCSLVVAWVAILLALVADAAPVVTDPGSPRHWNWAMIAFCLGSAVAFYLFFENTSRGFRQRRAISRNYDAVDETF